MKNIFNLISIFLISFAICMFFANKIIKFLKKIQPMGQNIKDFMPENHKKKLGTPTMGGLLIFLGAFVSIILGFLIVKVKLDKTLLALLVLFDYYFLLGIIDDQMKYVQNSNGIKTLNKLFHQVLGAFLAIQMLNPSPIIDIPFCSAIEINKYFFDFLCVIGIVGASNAFNFTDGLDGLATITIIPVIVFLIIFCPLKFQIVLVSILGALVGFLIFNKFPSKIFMGDCGSLPIGGCLALISISSNLVILFIISGFVCLIELLSVCIQIVSIRVFKKRVFLMSPFHHHLEKMGVHETSIVLSFGVVSIIFSLIAFYIKIRCN